MGEHPVRVRRRVVLDLAQVQIVLGSLMGDGSIEGEPGARRLVISEPRERAGYVWWKYEQLSAIADFPPQSLDGRVCFSTIAHPMFDDLATLIAGSANVSELLTPLGRAVWRTDALSTAAIEHAIAEAACVEEPHFIREG